MIYIYYQYTKKLLTTYNLNAIGTNIDTKNYNKHKYTLNIFR